MPYYKTSEYHFCCEECDEMITIEALDLEDALDTLGDYYWVAEDWKDHYEFYCSYCA
jgi:hypothetical protein